VLALTVIYLAWILYGFENARRAREARETASTLVQSLKSDEKNDYRQFGQFLSLHDRAYACVMRGREELWVADARSRQLCNDERLTPTPDPSKTEVQFANYDWYPNTLYQASITQAVTFRVLIEQRSFQIDLPFFVDRFRQILVPSLVFVSLLLVGIYGVMGSLRRLEREVHAVWTGAADDIVNAGYPRDLAGLAEVLTSFVSQVRDTRRELVEKAYELSNRMEHHRNNLMGDTLATEGLLERTHRVIESSDRFIEEICSVGRGTPRGEQIADVDNMFDEMIPIFKSGHPHLEVHVDVREVGVLVGVGEDVLNEMCFELLRNAGKHAARKVVLRARRIDDALRLEFHNDGETFPRENREDMFKWGVRGGTDKRGSGRGLYFVKQRVGVWGGRVALSDSAELGGACVCLDLPVQREL